MPTATYAARKSRLEDYFDRTAAHTWAQLTSNAPVSKIRETVRAGRDSMRALLLSWLPENLSEAALLDAGCGTGALAVEAAGRGARVLAVDVAGNLVSVAEERARALPLRGQVDFRVGDMLDEGLGGFDHVVAMDSLIHYERTDIVRVIADLSTRTRRSILFTFAPRTPALSVMHAAGKLFPRDDRAPAIEPVGQAALVQALQAEPRLAAWRIGRTQRVASGFYTSQALELVRS